jgi:hypothetical protein
VPPADKVELTCDGDGLVTRKYTDWTPNATTSALATPELGPKGWAATAYD